MSASSFGLLLLLVGCLAGGDATGQSLAVDGGQGGGGHRAGSAPRPDSIYAAADVRPRFVGGDAALAAYVRKTLRTPTARPRPGFAGGRVFVTFVLGTNGRVQDAHVVRGIGPGYDDEALRVVWLMPPWEPGRIAGQPVRVACTLPIVFSME